jgi:hypothetical protein
MDAETSEAIETLRVDLREVESSLRSDICRVESSLRLELGDVRGEIAKMRGEMVEMRGELKRHTEILFESVRDDIRLVAEGLAALSMKVDLLLPSHGAR